MSNNTITKQLLINNLRMGLNDDLTNLIKEYVFYDRVSQMTKYRKDRLFREIKVIKFGMTEGTTLLNDKEQFVNTRVRRWNYIRIWRRRPIPLVDRPDPLLGFMICSVCGNFYQTSKFLPITKEKIKVLPANLLRMVCCCSFQLTPEIQYSSITMSSYLRYDSEFDEDFSESSFHSHINSDDSDNSDQEDNNENEEIEYFYNNM
jgi:hypothetical protein